MAGNLDGEKYREIKSSHCIMAERKKVQTNRPKIKSLSEEENIMKMLLFGG